MIETEVKSYLATLRRSMKERHLKVFMEQLSSNFIFIIIFSLDFSDINRLLFF